MPDLELVAEEAEIPQDRAAKRFEQIRGLERKLKNIRRRIADKKTELSNLKEDEKSAVDQILEAARDEGNLPLLNVF